jgi:hypothetical protein
VLRRLDLQHVARKVKWSVAVVPHGLRDLGEDFGVEVSRMALAGSKIATIRRILEDGDKRKRKVAEEDLRRLLGEEYFARHERTQRLLARAISADSRPSDPQPAEAIERGPPTARPGPSGADPRRLRFGR